jgi:KaiC/GvpD/RAD55 family RecA-like ATPase
MARKSSRSTILPAVAHAQPGARAALLHGPSASDLDIAKTDALLQLQIGRTAHYYCVAIFVALLVDGFLVLFFPPNLFAAIPRLQLRSLYFLAFPLVAGLYLSLFALRVKWVEYQVWPWERHFSVTFGAFGLNLLIAYLYFARVFGFGATGAWSLLPWFYPVTLVGLTATLVGLAMTWPGTAQMKLAAVATALVPAPLALALYLPAASAATVTSTLALTLIASGGLFLASGSFLHLISSGTDAHERTLIASGQSRMFALADELRQKEEALRFREGTLVRREADAEDADANLERSRQSLAAAQAALDRRVQQIEGTAAQLRTMGQELAGRQNEISAQQRALEEREMQLGMREESARSQAGQLESARAALAEKEVALAGREVDLRNRERDLQIRSQELPEAEARLAGRQKEFEARWAELLRRESSPAESAGGVGAATGAPVGAGVSTEREVQLRQLQATLNEQNVTLGRKAKQLAEQRDELARLVEQEKEKSRALIEREAGFTRRETELSQKIDAVAARQKQLDELQRRYEARARELDFREVQIAGQARESEQRSTSVGAQEATLREREARAAETERKVDQARRELLERQRELEAREAELSLRRQSMAAAPATGRAGESTAALAERWKALELKERQLMEKEAQLTRRSYDAQQEGRLFVGLGAGAAPPRAVDRVPSGIARLDDLLLGGLPPRSHLMLVGAPFIGKEVALYAFVAEGLKRGESAILVTTSRSPTEVAQEIGVVAPQFKEYEQLGRVHWIDASNPAATPSFEDAKTVRSVVRGPGDHTDILKALVAAAKRAEGAGGAGFRVAFLSLSACLSQGDERSAFSFLQNFVGILKQRPALALYAVDGGTLSDSQLETIRTRMDGALQFKEERGRTFLSVQGLGEVQTRDWVEYRATRRALQIGSFSLERIR